MVELETPEDLLEAQRKATEEFNHTALNFGNNLAFVNGALVKAYVETLCNFLVATRQAQDRQTVPFTTPGHVVAACRMAELNFKSVLQEQLEKSWTVGPVNISIRTIIFDAEESELRCLVKLKSPTLFMS
jgi:hypothetical protein